MVKNRIADFVNEYHGKNLEEIEAELLNKDFSELIDIFNNVSNVSFTIHQNEWYSIDDIVPEDMRVETGFNSAKAKTYDTADKYVYYVDLQLYSFSEDYDEYCPFSVKTLAKFVYVFCLNYKKNSKEAPRTYEDICNDNYELMITTNLIK